MARRQRISGAVQGTAPGTQEGLRARLKHGPTLLAGMVMLPDPVVVELYAVCGFDTIILDAEHAPFDLRDIDECVRAGRAFGMPVLVRADSSDLRVSTMLDLGVEGLVFRFMRSSAQAEEAVRSIKFPPVGRRGVSRQVRASRYGTFKEDFATYLARANDSTIAIGLVEDKTGIEALPAICSNGSLDAILFGPTDLAVSLGLNPGTSEVQLMLDNAAEICRAANVPYLRLADSISDLTNASRRGASVIVYSVDIRLLKSSLLEARAALDATEDSPTRHDT